MNRATNHLSAYRKICLESAHEMMVMENVSVNLAETVLPLGSFAEMPALERHTEMPVLVFDHLTLEQCSAYPIGCSHEWLLLVSSPHRLQEYQAPASPNPGTPAPCQLLCILSEFAAQYTSPGWVGDEDMTPMHMTMIGAWHQERGVQKGCPSHEGGPR